MNKQSIVIVVLVVIIALCLGFYLGQNKSDDSTVGDINVISGSGDSVNDSSGIISDSAESDSGSPVLTPPALPN